MSAAATILADGPRCVELMMANISADMPTRDARPIGEKEHFTPSLRRRDDFHASARHDFRRLVSTRATSPFFYRVQQTFTPPIDKRRLCRHYHFSVASAD